MSDPRYLPNAPIIEALLNFQANASAGWKSEAIRTQMAAKWVVHTEIQELRPFQVKFVHTPQGELPPEVCAPETEGFIFRSKQEPTVHQVRRDGYTFSRLAPYETWESLEESALRGWAEYQDVLKPEELHSVSARFINQLKFPANGFRLGRYFTTPPTPPPQLDWQFHGFVNQAQFAIPGSPCVVCSTLTPAFDAVPGQTLSFILDVEIILKEPLSMLGRELKDVLSEMRRLKNLAFFGLLTEEAINHLST